jgi:hypothetical protein
MSDGKSKPIKWEENKNGCWISVNHGPNSKGYPLKRIGGNRKKLISHIVWEECFGEIPEGLGVLHKCDTPMCINPEHLFLGTNKDNSDDKIRKGRHKFPPRHPGESCPTAKLTQDQVLKIISDTRLHKIIAKEYGICKGHVWRLKSRREWRHIAI